MTPKSKDLGLQRLVTPRFRENTIFHVKIYLYVNNHLINSCVNLKKNIL